MTCLDKFSAQTEIVQRINYGRKTKSGVNISDKIYRKRISRSPKKQRKIESENENVVFAIFNKLSKNESEREKKLRF